ncbi:PREDICTED: uncharacterized protein LOC106751292 [Dinoponera quadriceps]|uniref:Uncharacterized protein LOC106751292 n=1 Tax=Dinoponera quadriceps TaxID=609295 RepID=A0A6P3Y9N2_DINQU|nr:PREDICTED: uncharacterized protein LOC106751292 [Dinoponera quadriceps]
MDPRRVLLLLTLLVCALGASPSSFKNARNGPNLIRRTRRISLNEFLVPPPPPKFPPDRTARLVPPAEKSGYFSKLMTWLNPFSYVPASPLPPPRLEAHPPQPRFIQPPPPPPPPPPPISGSFASGYGGSPPVYDRPPLPPIFANHPRAPTKNCNPCNKVPWVPINGEASHHHTAEASLVPPSSLPLQSSPSSGSYLPPGNPGAHDVYHAASQEVRAPDLSFASTLPTAGQSVPLLSPLPSPQVYLGATPPLFKATDFTYPVQSTLGGLPEWELAGPPPSGSSLLTGNGVFPVVVESSGNNGHIAQPTYPSNPLAHQHVEYTGLELPHVRNPGGHGDLFSSSTQVSHGHVGPALGAQGFENIAAYHQDSLDPASRQPSFGGSAPAGQLGAADNGGFHATESNGLGDLLDNPRQIVPNPPSSYGTSGLDRAPDNYEHRYNDLSSSGSVVTDSHVAPRTTDGSPAKIEDPIHFEESPLLDLTHKGESRTDSSPISSPTSNAFADLNGSIGGVTTLAPGVEFFGPDLPDLTESRYPVDVLKTIEPSLDKSNSIDDGANVQVADGIHHPADPQEQKVSYFQSLSHSLAGYFRPDVSSTTSRSTERGSFWGSLVNVYDGVLGHQGEQSAENIDVDSEEDETRDANQQGPKRNKKVQVIIPYTSKHTPVPFQPVRDQNYGRKVSYTADSGRDNYISEESRNKIKVTDLPTWPATVAIEEEVTGKPAGTKVNNSIDVHRLQKNIDNWTIQEYSRGTTASTVSPSSAKPYLFPSKQIPDKYLTTTEPVDHTEDDFRDESVKTFTLGGFSFNDQEREASSSNRMEGPRIQVVTGNKDQEPTVSTESSVAIVTAHSTNDFTWQGFPMDISPVSKERVYVVTPQPVLTTSRTTTTTMTTTKETERNSKVSTEASETDTEEVKEETDPFESIEKAYQVLPQAVNNLAVASTGPEKVPLWGIMEHEEFGSLGDSGHDDHEDGEPEIPVLYGVTCQTMTHQREECSRLLFVHV